MENENKKSEIKKTNNNLTYIIIAVIAVVLVVVILLVAKGCSKDSDKKDDNNSNEEVIKKEGAEEGDLVEAYGMSREDAINIVKSIYNGDNYEFSAEINEDSKYIVSVKNTITETTDKFLVDPQSTSKSFYSITE